MVAQRSYSTGHFELQLDGHVTTAYLRSVDGGYPRASVIEETFGTAHHRARHLATADIEPITLELGLSGARDVLHWIRASWRRETDRRSGQISHADFDLRATLDGSAKEPAYLKCKLQPERIAVRAAPAGRRVRGDGAGHQKVWTAAAFRLVLDGIAGVERVARIESFTIKQNVKTLRVGEHRVVQLEPTRVEFPALICTLALADAGGVLAWYERSVVADRAAVCETTGAIELLAPDRTATLLRLDLYEVGIHHLQVAASTANADAIKRVKFELHLGRMDLAA